MLSHLHSLSGRPGNEPFVRNHWNHTAKRFKVARLILRLADRASLPTHPLIWQCVAAAAQWPYLLGAV